MATARPLGCAAKPTSFSPFSGRITVSKMSKPASRRICASTTPGCAIGGMKLFATMSSPSRFVK